MGFATRKRLHRHLSFAHNVDPAAEDNEENRDLILNPPPLDPSAASEEKKSKRGRRKGAKNRLKLGKDVSLKTLLQIFAEIHRDLIFRSRYWSACKILGEAQAKQSQWNVKTSASY